MMILLLFQQLNLFVFQSIDSFMNKKPKFKGVNGEVKNCV